ncbi:MAG: calcium-translocating P-type ATPase, PMCA-type [Clostridia bacterium]|nr:calcium-translocating P-type ATPase, PMCA-type [Clostridia bacterium]
MIGYQSKKAAVSHGLSSEEAEQSRKAHGSNALTQKKGPGFLRRFISNLNDPVIRILLGALCVKLVLLFRDADIAETLGIAVAVFLAALISTLSEHGSARAFEKLSLEYSNVQCRVRRDGTVCELPLTDVVVGDTVLLSAGEMIPADGLLRAGELRTDQSAMTGESREIRKLVSADTSMSPASPSALFRGCTVISGGGEMEVVSVGDRTFLGQISTEIQEETRESPLKLRLSKLAKQISILGYVAAILVALAYLFNSFVLDSGMQWELIVYKLKDTGYLFSNLLHAFTLALTVLVVAVPEGLPMMIAVVLSSNIRKMVRDQVLVRKPVGIEAAGSMNILFTDKTGTLTEGKMRADVCLFANGMTTPLPSLLARSGEPSELITLALRFGTDASVGRDASGKRCVIGGSGTDRALLEATLKAVPREGYEAVSRLAFDSARKYSAVTVRGTKRLTFVMGAPERLLPCVRTALSPDGTPSAFSRTQTEKSIRAYTAKGIRVLAVAVSQEGIDASRHADGIKGSLTLLGAICISDPLRPEAAHSVAELCEAGIHVVMITGDNRDTAAYLASGCGILNPKNDLVLTGEELARLSDESVLKLLPRLAVVARALPTDKSRLVRLAQEAELVTGMTGDGINDAPALRRADVGFAMGSGTQVAKDAGDIIILDNNLASVTKAVLYGRNVFKSIRKFITLQLIMNLCAVAVTMICPFLGIDSPVTVVQMLWINLIMDTLGGLAFAGEPALPECMKEPPKRRDEPILNRYMAVEILWLGAFTVALCLFFLFSPTVTAIFRPHETRLYHLTAFFALFIFSSVFNCFNARTDRLKLTAGLRKNRVFLCIMIAILVIQLAFVYLGGSILRTAPLTPKEMLVTMLLSLAVFPADIIRKSIHRLLKKRGGY